MAEPIEHRNNNSNRKKIIVAGLLAVFLVVVTLRPTDKSPSSTTVCDGYAPPATLPVGSLPQLVAKSSQAELSILPMPVVNLQQVLAYDPFRSLPKSEPKPDAAHSAIVLAESTAPPRPQTQIPQFEIPVSAIITGGKRSAALIGERLYYENDVLENGWLIVAIKSSSILVEGQN